MSEVTLAIIAMHLVAHRLDAGRRPVVRTHTFTHQVVLVRRRHVLLVVATSLLLRVLSQFQLLVVRDEVLLTDVDNWRVDTLELPFLIFYLHAG